MAAEMGWQDRDYARWTEEERERFLGSGAVTTSRRGRVRPGAGLAILVSGAFLALGQLPAGRPILPTFHLGAPTSPAAPGTGTITGPRTAELGTPLSLHGTAPPGNGPVTVQGSYDGGKTWQTLSSVQSRNGTYTTSIPLSRQGQLQLEILFPDGSSAVGSVLVVGGSAT